MRHPETPWHVLLDCPAWRHPVRVSRHADEASARAVARRLNAAGPGVPGGPLYFVERQNTSDVLDTEHSREREESHDRA